MAWPKGMKRTKNGTDKTISEGAAVKDNDDGSVSPIENTTLRAEIPLSEKKIETPPDVVADTVKKGYKYLGTDGSNFYFTKADGTGAYTHHANGKFGFVGNRFDLNFVKTLKK
jgi:hypothetical protein